MKRKPRGEANPLGRNTYGDEKTGMFLLQAARLGLSRPGILEEYSRIFRNRIPFRARTAAGVETKASTRRQRNSPVKATIRASPANRSTSPPWSVMVLISRCRAKRSTRRSAVRWQDQDGMPMGMLVVVGGPRFRIPPRPGGAPWFRPTSHSTKRWAR